MRNDKEKLTQKFPQRNILPDLKLLIIVHSYRTAVAICAIETRFNSGGKEC
jgi:hypothetical protein